MGPSLSASLRAGGKPFREGPRAQSEPAVGAGELGWLFDLSRRTRKSHRGADGSEASRPVLYTLLVLGRTGLGVFRRAPHGRGNRIATPRDGHDIGGPGLARCKLRTRRKAGPCPGLCCRALAERA